MKTATRKPASVLEVYRRMFLVVLGDWQQVGKEG